MKKLLYLLLFIPFGLSGQTQVIGVGTTANDGTGDPLRTAMQKINTNFTAVRDSFGNIYRETQTDDLVTGSINDSLNARMAAALLLEDYALLSADTNQYGGAITRTFFDNYSGTGGSSGKFYVLSG